MCSSAQTAKVVLLTLLVLSTRRTGGLPDGKKALEIGKREHPYLTLMDLSMPILDRLWHSSPFRKPEDGALHSVVAPKRSILPKRPDWRPQAAGRTWQNTAPPNYRFSENALIPPDSWRDSV
jgi:hypothetical protein